MTTMRARRVFDGLEMRPDAVVTVEGGRITALSGSGHADLDLGDVTLLPGLVDCHVHLAFDASDDPVSRLDEPGLADRMREAARQHLAAGVTTVRDLGDRDYLALGLGLGPDGPEILAAGPPITAVKGHCWWLGGEAAGEQAVREAVRERAARGAHVIKMMVTGGEMTEGTHSHLCQYEPAELEAAAAEAHAHDLPITGHAHCAEGIRRAVEAGFDSVEHCSFIVEDGVRQDPEVIELLAATGTVVSITAGMAPTAVPPPPRVARLLPLILDTVRSVYAAGVRFVIGTDAGIGPAKPHGVLPYGAQMLVDLGFEPIDVLRAITSVGADTCRVGDRKGRIAPGADADLVAVEGDPLADMAALRRPVAVFREGRRIIHD
jgi:imidazolonepropionase-like amidohydrolase